MGTREASGEVRLVVNPTITNRMTDEQVATATGGGTLLSGRMTNGVSEEQFSRAWEEKSRALGSGVSEDIDLFDLGSIDIGAGAGADMLGQALTFMEIVTLVIQQTGGTGRLQINATDPSNKLAWMPTLTVANGGAGRPPTENGRYWTFMLHNPATDAFPVTDASSHMVKFGASGGTVEYDIYVLGRHDTDESSSSSQSTKSSASSGSSSSTSSISSVSSSSSSTSQSVSTSSSSHSRSSSSVSTNSSSSQSVSTSSSSQSVSTSSTSSLSTSSVSSSSSSSLVA